MKKFFWVYALAFLFLLPLTAKGEVSFVVDEGALTELHKLDRYNFGQFFTFGGPESYSLTGALSDPMAAVAVNEKPFIEFMSVGLLGSFKTSGSSQENLNLGIVPLKIKWLSVGVTFPLTNMGGKFKDKVLGIFGVSIPLQ